FRSIQRNNYCTAVLARKKITPPTLTSVSCRWCYVLELLDPTGLAGIVNTMQTISLSSLVFCPSWFVDEIGVLLEAVSHPIGTMRTTPFGEITDIKVRRRLVMVRAKSSSTVHTTLG